MTLHISKCMHLVAFILGLALMPASNAALGGSATITWKQVGTRYDYTIKLSNTGTTPIGTFWFAWIPGADYLPTQPSTAGSPAGWPTHNIFHGSPGYSIQWVASTPLAVGQSLSGFTFSSTDTPSTVLGVSSAAGHPKITTSTLYTGAPFTGPGFIFAVTQGVSSSDTIKLSKSAVIGGNPVAGVVTLAEAPSVDTFVPINSSDPTDTLIHLGGVTIPAHKQSQTFEVDTRGVAGAKSVTLTANFSGGPQSATLTLNPATLTDFSLVAAVVGGNVPEATIHFNGLTGAASSVQVSSSVPNIVSGPSPQLVAAQSQVTPIALTTLGVDATTQVSVTVKSGATSLQHQIDVNPASLKSVTSSALSTSGGHAVTFTGFLDGKVGPSGGSVTLKSSDPTVCLVPSSVLLLAQASKVSTVVNVKAVTKVERVTISMTYRGMTKSVDLVVKPTAIIRP